ncbi:MAG TPA: PEP/pyruvate-binding domain-containing protein, partial [Vicinamibacteria bacterium]|nr:PEP/pyruvate-binding domain-containing protein [Vicinamibacteria bacterium]
MASLIFLDEIGAGEAALVGEKAASLARLKRLGFPVPDGFVLLEDATLDAAALAPALARLPQGPVAVRSSSTAEDLAGASFAGQYVTHLGVSGVEEVARAAQACRESASGAQGYALTLGAAAGRMAVLVQQMVEPRVAGVAFGRNPQDPAQVLVEAVRGRGARLLAGAASPDRYALDRETGVRVLGPEQGSLDAPGLLAVADLVRRVEQALGAPQDVEWAIGPGELPDALALLQARPITTEGLERHDPRLDRLTRANIGEVLPGAVTPLTFTTVGAFLEHAFRTVLARAGLLPRDAPAVVVLYRQRLYLNLSLALDVAARLPGISAEDAERMILGGGATAGGAAPAPPFSLTALRIGLRLLRMGRGKPAEIAEAERLVSSLPPREVIRGASAEGLADLLESWASVGRRVAATHVLTSGASAAALSVLARMLEALARGPAAERASRLTAGLQDVESAAPTLALEALAARLANDPHGLAWLAADPAPGPRALDGAPDDIRAELEAFLERFGHRALSEGELASPAWEDDPTPVLMALRSLTSHAGRARFGAKAKAGLRRAEEESLLSRLPALPRSVLSRGMRSAQQGVRERERTKSLTVAVACHGRRLARAAGAQLAARGVLAAESEVFLLEWPELLRALSQGDAPPRPALERRRRRLANEGALDAPREVSLRTRGATLPLVAASNGDVLTGIGVSGGAGRGPARILREGVPPRVAPGDVLVAPVLDAALGPLLASCAGAVAEMGGVLSHGSVVARELGVPCVVDVRGATSVLREGELILVDGSAGEVRRVGSGREGTDGAPPGRADQGVLAEDETREQRARLENRKDARESVYFNLQDEASGLRVVASLGARAGGRGEAVLALSTSDGRVLFGLDFAPATGGARELEVAGAATTFAPVSLRARTRLAPLEGATFPPGPLPLVLAPRSVEVELDLVFAPTGPAVDFSLLLTDAEREAVRPLGDHHIEQAGTFVGRVEIDGRRFEIEGRGSRDHSWGRRDWTAYDHSHLFLARFGDDLVVHALTVVCNGRLVEGGFLWRDGRAERITSLLYAPDRSGDRLRSLQLEVRTGLGPPLLLHGEVERTLVVPVQI